ncbi:MAG: arsenate reductase family protein [Clostridia bacterium]|nr:arsenate reductase family protein [Clostridia bacterium]
MNIQIFGKSKCFDTKKAERYFKERRIKYQYVDLSKFSMSKGEIKSVMSAVGGLDNMLDSESKSFKSSTVSYLAYEEDKIEKIMHAPLLLKTPIVRNGKKATVGYCPEIWAQWE